MNTDAGTALNPFPGLRPFRDDEASLFFGRDGHITSLLQRLNRGRFLGVLGTSASGKSSLVFAGLLPRLRSGCELQGHSAWRVAVMRPGVDPLAALETALADDDVFGAQDWLHATLRASSHGLVEATRRISLDQDESLLVVVDQFEEIFRYRHDDVHGGDASTAFVKLLLAAAASETPISILLTMRSDFLGDCAQFPGLPEALNENQYLVPRMTRDELREAIEAPLITRLIAIEPALAERLLNDAGDKPDHLPLLQHALMRTWEAWSGRKRKDDEQGRRPGAIGMVDYEAVGTIKEALLRHATEVQMGLLFSMPGTVGIELPTLRRVFQRLTNRRAGARDTRRPSSAQDLADVAGVDFAVIQRLFDAYTAEGRTFLTSADVTLRPESIVDITHESLIRLWTTLDRWIAEEVDLATEFVRVRDVARLREKSRTMPKRQAELWREKDLARAESWERALSDGIPGDWRKAARAWATRYTNDPQDLDRALDFIDGSRRKERTRYLLKVSAVVAVVAAAVAFAALAWWALRQRDRAEEAVQANNELIKASALQTAAAAQAADRLEAARRESAVKDQALADAQGSATGNKTEMERLAKEARDARDKAAQAQQAFETAQTKLDALARSSPATEQRDTNAQARITKLESDLKEAQGTIQTLRDGADTANKEIGRLRLQLQDPSRRNRFALLLQDMALPEYTAVPLRMDPFNGRAIVAVGNVDNEGTLTVAIRNDAVTLPRDLRSTGRLEDLVRGRCLNSAELTMSPKQGVQGFTFQFENNAYSVVLKSVHSILNNNYLTIDINGAGSVPPRIATSPLCGGQAAKN